MNTARYWLRNNTSLKTGYDDTWYWASQTCLARPWELYQAWPHLIMHGILILNMCAKSKQDEGTVVNDVQTRIGMTLLNTTFKIIVNLKLWRGLASTINERSWIISNRVKVLVSNKLAIDICPVWASCYSEVSLFTMLLGETWLRIKRHTCSRFSLKIIIPKMTNSICTKFLKEIKWLKTFTDRTI